jgi:hypothetical protein
LRGGNPDLNHNGVVGPVDRARIREEAKREAIRHHYVAVTRHERHHMYHEARAAKYDAVAGHAEARARVEEARAHAW